MASVFQTSAPIISYFHRNTHASSWEINFLCFCSVLHPPNPPPPFTEKQIWETWGFCISGPKKAFFSFSNSAKQDASNGTSFKSVPQASRTNYCDKVACLVEQRKTEELDCDSTNEKFSLDGLEVNISAFPKQSLSWRRCSKQAPQ